MAELIDISQFKGVKTHADVEDLSEIIAQNIENLKIVDGQLEKTFAAGSASGIPVFPLTTINTKISSDYSVQNVYTFISDKFGTDEHRYIVAIINSSNVLKLFWYDPSLPNVIDHLQVEDDILLFTTSGDSGLVQGDYVVISDVKNNASPQVAIADTDNYDIIDYKTANKHYINTDQAKTWGGSFFATTAGDGLVTTTFGGKHDTHLSIDADASVNDSGTGVGSFTNIALLAQSGEVLCMYSHNIGSNGRIRYTIGGTKAELNTTLYNTWKAYSSFYVNAMEQFGNAIYVYYSAEGTGSYKINAVVKYQLGTNNTIVETGIHGHSPTTHSSTYWGSTPVASDLASSTYTFGRFHVTNSNKLFLLVPGNDTHLYEVTTTVTAINNVPTLSSGYSWVDITSITTNSGSTYEFVVIGETTSANHKFHFYNTANGNWTSGSTTYDFQLHHMSKMDFGENNGNHESIVVNLEKVGAGDQFIRYSEHNNSAIGVTGFVELNTATFPIDTVVMQLRHAYKNPGGAKYLFVCTNDSSVTPLEHGRVFRVDTDKRVSTLTTNNPNTDKGWNPTCIDDVATGASVNNQFFEHAKAYIVSYGVVYNTHTNSNALPKGALNRMTDIGWGANTWNGTGTLDYKWTDIISKYNFPEISNTNSSTTPTFYHKRDKNPIVVSNDTIRFIPGSIGKVSNNEAKGLWLGYINRSLFNNSVPIAANWYGYSNVLNNPFSLKTGEIYETNNDIRGGNSVKYNCTAIYDGVQETLFDKNKELVFTTNNINKSIVEIEVEIANINNLNKRITGINIYRSIGTGGVYGSFQLIGHMTFVDTNNDLSAIGTLKEVSGKFFQRHIAHLKVADDPELTELLSLSTTESILGANKYALDFSGGFDGIDDISEGEDSLSPFFINSGTIRAIDNQINRIIVSDSSLIANNTTYLIEDEGVQTASTAIVTNQSIDTGIALSYDHDWTTAQTTFTVVSNISNIIKTGDTIRIGTNTVDIVVNSVGTTSFVGTPTSQRNGIGGNVKIRNVASPEAIVAVSRGHSFSYGGTALSSTGTATSHLNLTEILRKPSVLYAKVRVDSDANFDNTFLDNNGDFNGSTWKIKKRSFGKYSTTKNGTGAFSGRSVGFLQLNNFTTDFPNGVSQNQLSGSIVRFGQSTFQIEGNSAYEAEIGGCWVKTTENVDQLPDSNFSAQTMTFTGQLLEGFSLSTASGASTPGMGYSKDGDKITITCRDFNLDDLGESPIQTIYSNRVNGQFAKIVKSRLFLGNVYLNPEDKAEERQDYIAYSEINQFDTIPVSNVIAFEDREGGAVTGLASLFNRLVIFKPQALFILSIPNPTDPTSWEIVESKHNIGNISPRGIVEVHDSVYFVYHDGIYEISANMAASSTATPSVMNKISADIEDQFMASTNKTSIRAIYDPNRQEILFRWLENTTEKVWAYNYVLKTWRIIDMGSFNLTLMNYDENGSPLNYDIVANQIIKFDTNNASITKWKSKKFPLDLHRKRLIRYMTIQYTGNDAMTANVYLDGETSASFTKTGLSAGTKRFPVKRYANRVELELTTPSSTNPLTIKRLQLEVE